MGIVAFFSACEKSSSPDVDVTDVLISTDWLAITDSETVTISARTFDGGTSVNAPIIWKTSDAQVATVSGGAVSGRGDGVALITAEAGGVESEPCSVHVAGEWIVYSGAESLRMITPDNTRDMAVPGTFPAELPILRLPTGIVYAGAADITPYSYLLFRPFDGDSTERVFADRIEPIRDIRRSPSGNILLSKFGGNAIYSFPSARGLSGEIDDYIALAFDGVDIREFDVSPSGGYIVDATTPVGPRMLFLSATGAPLDTLITTNGRCPRFSPDGSKVAYGSSARLWIADVATLVRSELLSEGLAIEGLSWSPDGARIAICVRNPLGKYDLWIGNTTTGATQRLTNAEPADKRYFPHWAD